LYKRNKERKNDNREGKVQKKASHRRKRSRRSRW